MDLGFIIKMLQKVDVYDEDISIAKGDSKIIYKWSEAKEYIRWQLRRK